MKSYFEEIWVNYPSRRGFINITSDVQKALHHCDIKEGLVLVDTLHNTASVFVNADESALNEKYKKWLGDLAAQIPIHQSLYNDSVKDDADDRMKRHNKGREVVVAVSNGELDFAPGEQLYFREFDSSRPRQILIKVIGE